MDVLYEVGYPPYTVNMSMMQYYSGRWIMYAVIIVIAVLLVFITIKLVINYTEGRPEQMSPVSVSDPTLLGLDSNIGSSADGVVHPTLPPGQNASKLINEELCLANNGEWTVPPRTSNPIGSTPNDDIRVSDSSCSCKTPWYGDRCQNQSHPTNMYYIDDVSFDSVQVPGDRPLTFNSSGRVDPNSCTSLCNEDQTCFGVVYSKGVCSMITSNPILSQAGSTALVYMDGVRAVDERTVHVYSITQVAGQTRPLRYWLPRDEVTAIPINTVTSVKLSDVDDLKAVNDGLLIGVWSLEPFTEDEFDQLLNQGEDCDSFFVYIDKPTSASTHYSLQLPSSFTSKTAYVMYTHSDSEQNAFFV